jgi:hypothetical protein
MSRFDARCANEPGLTKLRTSIREFLRADRAEFGWQPTVDSWLGKWDEGFRARLGDAGFLGLTIAAGRLYSSIGMSEHGAGSDLAAGWTTATRSDGGWLISGTKVTKVWTLRGGTNEVLRGVVAGGMGLR